MTTATTHAPVPPATPTTRGSVRHRVAATVAQVARQAGLPVLIALLVGAVVLAATGHNPLQIYGRLLVEAFGTPSRIDATLAATTPLLFTAVAAAFAYRAGMFTIGVEGSFVLGGLTAAVIGAQMASVPSPFAAIVALIGALVAGLAVAVVPALLRAWWRVDEVVTTLMFNFIVAGLAGWSVQTFFQEVGQANSATAFVTENAELPAFLPPNQANWGLIIAVGTLVGYALFMRYTTLGFEFRAVGSSPRFSVAQGLRTRTVILVALVGAGLIGGLGGGAHALGIVHRYTAGFSASFGFAGIAIALIARFHPVGIFVGALLFGALNAAGATVQLFINLPVQLIDVLQGTVMVFAVAQFALPRAMRRARARRGGRS